MLDVFMGQCAPNAAFLPISSLNEPVDVGTENAVDDVAEVIDQLTDPADSVEIDMINRETRAAAECRVRAFVAGLSPYLRCVALRLYWEEQSQSEIAVALGRSRSAICHAVRRLERLGRRDLADLAI
jgi:DNA-directed RNA polymerase specialized sigma24 family protein